MPSPAACMLSLLILMSVDGVWCASAEPLGDPTEGGYRLVWAEEFDEQGPPDPANWGFERGFKRNEELQWYQRQNARCEEGMLVIDARRERVKNPGYRPPGRRRGWSSSRKHAEYTSASLNTRGKQQWQYGRFIVRAKIDGQRGLWPAIWFLGASGEWPACGEIDLMECYQGILLANVAWQRGAWTPEWDSSRTPLAELGDADWTERFHTWRMDWTREKIDLYVDDRLLNTVDLKRTLNPDGRNPFHQSHHVLLNLAVGGAQGGDPSKAEFPSRYLVDFVRVYQLQTE